MLHIISNTDELIGLIEADAVVRVLQPDTAYLTNRLGRLLRDAVHVWSQGDHSHAARRHIEDLYLVARSLDLQLGVGCSDIFAVVHDLDAAVEQGLVLMPGFDRPLLRLALQSKASAGRRV